MDKSEILYSKSDSENRKALESKKNCIFILSEFESRKDSIRNTNSGINHVLANIMRKNMHKLGIDLDMIRGLDKKNKAIYLSKLIQNIKLCRKSKVQLFLLNYKEKMNSMSFLLTLGASTQQCREALDF